ncbi:MAG TPA: serine/threonine-protein kinase, partial [Kofleriaceae bacterium]|nr:serine/threonine-protein kinase [Kofleriaceae bacterium]
MKRCPKCGTSFPDEANFCPKDAGRLVMDDGAGAAATGRSDLVGGRFKLGLAIGGGWTGQVHEAEDTQEGNQPCVLKLVDAAVFPTPLMLQRTERELKQLERLDAPGVARIIAHGREGEQMWVASELVHGTPLHDLIASQGPQPLDRATSIVLAIGRALSESAKAGVIHRDLAPKNVMVVDDGVKLINFGVPVPGDGEVQGVPEFVSPEQVDGKPVDQRSNIYSLGAIYYYLLTGQPPFTGERQAVLELHRSGTPHAPSQLAAVPPLVEAVVMKAL